MSEISELLAAVERSNALLAELLTVAKAGGQLMLNQAETAAALGVSEKTIAQRRREGVMRESDLFPGRVLFSKQYLRRLLAAHDGDALGEFQSDPRYQEMLASVRDDVRGVARESVQLWLAS